MFDNREEFLAWVRGSHDVIAVERSYIDLTGDLASGVFLSQLMYYHTLTKDGQLRLTIERDGKLWLAKKREDWWDECRMSPRQVDRIVKDLKKLGLVETKTLQFHRVPMMHIRIIWGTFLPKMKEVFHHPSLSPIGKLYYDDSVNSTSTNRQTLLPPNVEVLSIQRLHTKTTYKENNFPNGKTEASTSAPKRILTITDDPEPEEGSFLNHGEALAEEISLPPPARDVFHKPSIADEVEIPHSQDDSPPSKSPEDWDKALDRCRDKRCKIAVLVDVLEYLNPGNKASLEEEAREKGGKKPDRAAYVRLGILAKACGYREGKEDKPNYYWVVRWLYIARALGCYELVSGAQDMIKKKGKNPYGLKSARKEAGGSQHAPMKVLS